MTIRRGQDWGCLGPTPAGLVVAPDDAGLFGIVNGATLPPAVGLTRGDLARTLGAAADGSRFGAPGEVLVAPVDLLVVDHDGGTHRAAAHVVARRSWWWGDVLAAMNAQYRGRWDVAPRAHPNDGLMDVLTVGSGMGVRQRWIARRRLPTGTHLPHPAVSVRRVAAGEWSFARPRRLWLDGVAVGRTRSLRIRVDADALTVCV